MIHGTVVGLQARISITLRLSGRSDVEVECIVDTGFEGALTLPPAMIATLGFVYSVIGYYLRHKTEVDAYLLERQHRADEVRKEAQRRFNPVEIRARLLARRNQQG